MLRRFKIRKQERGFRFVDGEFIEILAPGTYWYLDPMYEIRVDVQSVREPWIVHPDLDVIVDSGALTGEATVIDLQEDERALVWIDGRFETVLVPGIYALWNVFHEIVVEVLNAEDTRLEQGEIHNCLGQPDLEPLLRRFQVEAGSVGLSCEVEDYQQTLYRKAQLALRAVIGTRKLDLLLTDASPTLMRRRELEVLERVADSANLTVVLGEQGLADRVVKLL